jgi:glucose-1-phosphate thymidylyltransferase
MISYPLQNLVQAGINRIFVVTGGEHFSAIGGLLGSGEEEDLARIGINASVTLSYGVQRRPRGIAHALGLAEGFAGDDPVCVVLGDNIFEDEGFLTKAVRSFDGGACIFLKQMPEDLLFEESPGGKRRAKYGMADVIGNSVRGVEEKPETPKSNYAVTGAYIYDRDVFSIVRTLEPSGRGELEITDVNNAYILRGAMRAYTIDGEWTDAGGIESLHRATVLARLWAKRRADA